MIDLGETTWQVATIIHLAATWALVGLIWTIQVAHYPSFDAIDRDEYRRFQAAHMTKMGSLVGPPWLIEGLGVLAVFLLAPTTTTQLLAVVGGLLEAVVIAVTLRASIPAHEKLSNGFDEATMSELLRTNWWRTWAWTARGVIAVALAVLAL